MIIRLGNVNVEQIEKRTGIELSQEIRDFLNRTRSECATLTDKNKWHCFDIPFVMVCGSKEFANNIFEKLSPYGKNMQCELGIIWEKE